MREGHNIFIGYTFRKLSALLVMTDCHHNGGETLHIATKIVITLGHVRDSSQYLASVYPASNDMGLTENEHAWLPCGHVAENTKAS